MLKQKSRPQMLYENIDMLEDRAARISDYDSSNRRMLRSLLEATRYAVEHELTERQRTCFTWFYYDKMKQADIARELGVHPATVCRCIQSALRRINHYARYSALPFLGRPFDN